MRRMLILLVLLTLVSIGAAWIAKLDGSVRMLVGGWQLDLGFSLLLFLVIALMVLAVVATEAVRILWATPGRWRERAVYRRHQRGLDLLDEGYAALFAGDADLAFRRGRRAEQLLDMSSSAKLLTLRGAADKGDKKQVGRLTKALDDASLLPDVVAKVRAEMIAPPVAAAPEPVAVEEEKPEPTLEEKAAAARQTP